MGMAEGPPPAAGEGGTRRGGLGYRMTSLMLITQMAGAGFLSLPKAVANSGWLGVVIVVVSCSVSGFSGIRLGQCWVMLEERWPHLYAGGSRQPYMDIAYEALGKPGRIVAMTCVLLSVFGASTVFLILIPSFLTDLLPVLSLCEWLLVGTAVLLPFTWLGTPKDYWLASIVAAACTAITILIIFVELIVERPNYPNPVYRNPTIYTFALGFASILFAFGGVSVFPTIQNDMKDRSLFGRSVFWAFSALLTMYLPVTVAGYAVIGYEIKDNILLNVDTNKVVVKVAIVMEVLNLMGTYLIACNPIFQVFEDQLRVGKGFGWQRCVLRSCVVAAQVLIGLAVPNFGKILNLFGASTVTLCSFVLPGIAYLRLSDKNGVWEPRMVPLWERTLIILIVCVGVVGGIVSTAFAIIDILDPASLGSSCFVNFFP